MINDIRFVVGTLSQSFHVRVYSPSDGNELAYKVDDAFFADNPKRRVSIRESLPGELENGFELAEHCGLSTLYAQRPALWLLVLSSGNGTYRVLPAFRGPHYFPVVCAYQGTFAQCCNDAACFALFDEFNMRGGLDSEAWAKWEAEWKAAAYKAVANQQAKLTVAPERVN